MATRQDPRDAALQARIDKLKQGNVHYTQAAPIPHPPSTVVKPKLRKPTVPTAVIAAIAESAKPVLSQAATAREDNLAFFIRTVFKPLFSLVTNVIQTNKTKSTAVKAETGGTKSSVLADAATFIGKGTWSLVKFTGKTVMRACKALADLLIPVPKAITVKVASPQTGDTVEITATGTTSVTVNTAKTPTAGEWKSKGQAVNAIMRSAKVPEVQTKQALEAKAETAVVTRIENRY
jgi:hypothetical protein